MNQSKIINRLKSHYLFVIVPGFEDLLGELKSDWNVPVEIISTDEAPVPFVATVAKTDLTSSQIAETRSRMMGQKVVPPSSNVIFVGPPEMAELTIRGLNKWLTNSENN